MSGQRVNYSVRWHWRADETSGERIRSMVDIVKAPNAERAIANLKKMILEEYEGTPKDIVVEEVFEYHGRLR